MSAKYILAVAASIFLIAALIRGPRSAQGRTWLLVCGIFLLVSVWLFTRS